MKPGIKNLWVAAPPVTQAPQSVTQPLTDAEIDAVTIAQWGEQCGAPLQAHRAYARAIEKSHGIGITPAGGA